MRHSDNIRRAVALAVGLAFGAVLSTAHTFTCTPSLVWTCLNSPPASSPKLLGVYLYPPTVTCTGFQSTIRAHTMGTFGTTWNPLTGTWDGLHSGSAQWNLEWHFDIEWVPSSPSDVPIIGSTYPYTFAYSQQSALTASALFPEVPAAPPTEVFRVTSTSCAYPNFIFANINSDGSGTPYVFYPWANQSGLARTPGSVGFALENGKYIAHVVMYDLALQQTYQMLPSNGASAKGIADIYRRLTIYSVDDQNVP